jgi:GT2 family glycosyltransferase
LPPDDVVIVDNASHDGSAIHLKDACPGARIFEAAANRGYGAGMNMGMSKLADRADAMLLLTHECLLAPDALEILAARMRADPKIGALGPLVAQLSNPTRVYSAGGWIDYDTWRPHHYRDPPELAGWSAAEPREVAWLDGCALLLRTTAVESVGFFDEHYFMYFEETDLLLRIARGGWRVECVPRAVAWQEPGPKPKYLWTRNRLRFLARQAPRHVVLREMSAILRRSLRASTRGERRREERAALRDFLRRKHGPPPERHRPTGSRPSTQSRETPLDG